MKFWIRKKNDINHKEKLGRGTFNIQYELNLVKAY